MAEVVDDGVSGFVIPIRNANAMAKKIYEISQLSEEQKYRITAKALETIKQQHTEELMVAGMIDLYKSL